MQASVLEQESSHAGVARPSDLAGKGMIVGERLVPPFQKERLIPLEDNCTPLQILYKVLCIIIPHHVGEVPNRKG